VMQGPKEFAEYFSDFNSRMEKTEKNTRIVGFETDTASPRISAPSSPPPILFCGRLMRQQRMYSFRRVVSDLHIV